ncbi:MAG: STT3 domain-containing protein [Candidatus Aenigmatarchaeota archaeon]
MSKNKNSLIENKEKIAMLFGLVITILILYPFLQRSYYISKYSGTVLTDNWWNALNWIRENTPECAVIATYWDPGHFITGIAERPVVFDGASQNSLRTITLEGNMSREEIEKIIGISNFRIRRFEKDGKYYVNVTTARIQDIATTLLTSDEEQAIKILRRYLIPECNNTMYYIASEDLLWKSQWWTYFSTWDPKTKKGTKYFYIPAQYAGKKSLGNSTYYLYPISRVEVLVIKEEGKELDAFLQVQNEMKIIRKFIYFESNFIKEKSYENYEIDGTLFLFPDKSNVIFMNKELENSLFTRMFLLNGAGLKRFELVRNFGGEVKIFKVIFD